MKSSQIISLVLLGATVAGCPAPECEEGEELVDGECEPVDTTPTFDTGDTGDTDVLVAKFSQVEVQWDITDLPTTVEVTVECDGRVVVDEGSFTFFDTFIENFEVTPGEQCQVVLTDERGGLLPSGRASVCGTEVASWRARRGTTQRIAAEFEAFGCIPGCPDPVAENYVEQANLDDGSCQYIFGCNDERAYNYDPIATKDDGSCDFGGFAPMSLVVFMDGRPIENLIEVRCEDSLALAIGATTTPPAWSTQVASTAVDAGFDCEVFVTDDAGDAGPSGVVRVCDEVVLGWDRTAPQSAPYTVSVGTFFTTECSGCTDPAATNYAPDAQIDDGSCVQP